MVGGAIRTLLLLELMTLIINMTLNLLLIKPLGLLGACLVIVLTKLSMCIFTFCICQIRFKLIQVRDLIFPMTLAAACLLIYFILDRITKFYFCPAIVLIIYIGVLWKAGPRIIGTLHERET
jgi:O-antigen/teichoic acid export membrane protein